MNSTARTRKIHLRRMMAGWHVFNSADYAHEFNIHKIGAGVWRIDHTDRTNYPTKTEESWIVENLDKARSFIANTI